MLCVGAALPCPTATCHSAPSAELAHPGLLCNVQDALVELAVEEPRDREDATNDCAQLHKEVRQLLSRLRVTHGNRREVVPQIDGRRLPAGNFVGVGRELVHMERVSVQWHVRCGHHLREVLEFVGSTLLRSLSMCCSDTQLSINFIRTSANATGRSLRGHGCGICCPGSGFLGPLPESTCPSIHATRLVPPPCVQWPRTNLHMRVARQTNPSRQKTMHALLCQQQRRLSRRSLRGSGSQRTQVCVCLCSHQHSFQLGSIVRQHAGCTVHLPPP